MRIAVFGTGGAGGYFGAQLARAGEEVSFVARGEHLKAIRANGLHIDSTEGDLVIHPKVASDEPRDIGPVDVVLLGVKTWQVAEAGEKMRPMIGEGTFVVPLQNGIEAAGQLAAALGRDRVVGGTCGTISWVSGPGHIRSVGPTNIIRFGELDRRPSERIERLRAAFARTPVTVEAAADIEKRIWEKFLFVTAFGAVGAVTRAPIGTTRSLPETRRLLKGCMEEAYTLGRARGVALADTAVADAMAFIDTFAPSATTSLQRDITDGRPSELEAWSGAVVRLGRELGIPTPVHEFIYDALLPAELRARGKVAFAT